MRLNYTVMMFAILGSTCWAEPTPRLSMAHATEIATNAYPGKIESSELEQEKGRSVYSFDIRRAGQSDIHEILVDANTGDIVSQTVETASQQAAEKKANVEEQPSVPAYHIIKKISVPGDGGWDVLTVDSQARRLYISHSTQVDVLDIDQDKLVGQILDTPGVHDIALAPALARGFTSNGKEDKLTVFDLKNGKVLNKVEIGGKNPDILVYDPASRRVFTFNGKSSDATAIDAAMGKVVGRIPLGGKPEFAVADGQGTIFVNLEDKSSLLSFDSDTLKLKQNWPLSPCEEPSALAMDLSNHRLFAGCGNKLMVVVDAENGHVITSLPIGEHVDGDAFNPATQEIFASNGDGTLTVIHEDSPNTYHVEDNVITQKGARTLALDEKSGRIFLPTAELGPQPAPSSDQPHPRPAVLPGTFKILVVAH